MAERRRVTVVHDPDDTPLLTTLGWDAHPPLRTLIVRPTPGAKDQGTLVRDLLAALGKNPFPTQAPGPLTERWALCHAWIAAATTADVVIDRAHRLPIHHLLRLAALARDVGASLWLLWPAPAPEQLARALDQDAPDTVRARVIDRFQAHRALTERQHRYRAQRPAPDWGREPRPWPAVPRTDFPRFLATCRRTLTERRYAKVLTEYRTTHAAARARFPDPVEVEDSDQHHRARTIAYLRDEVLPGVADPEQALVRVRAAQAALLPAGLLITHDPTHHGVDTIPQLGAALTAPLCQALNSSHYTAGPALLALALHLNHDPGHLEVVRCRDVAVDGSTITLTPYDYAPGRRSPYAVEVRSDQAALAELAYAPVRLPAFAQPLLAAHRAYRIATGVRTTAPLFPTAADGKKATTAAALRATARAQAQDVKVHTPWIKTPGALPAPQSTWAGRRALAIHVLIQAPVPAGRWWV